MSRKSLIFFVTGLLILINSCQEFDDTDTFLGDDLCEKDPYGEWKSLSNECDYLCKEKIAELKIKCQDIRTQGCYCGESRCWNGESCQLINEED